jgi:ABC-2 type transport system permease protein
VLLIAKRDYIATIRTKAFLIGLVVAPLLFGGGFLALALMKDKPEGNDKRIAVLDRTGVLAGAVIQAAGKKNAAEMFDKLTGRQIASRYVFEPLNAEGDPKAQLLSLSDRVRRRELFGFIEIPADALQPANGKTAPRVSYYTNAGGIDEMRRWLAEPVNDGFRRVRLAQLGVDPARIDEIGSPVRVERLGLYTRDPKTGEVREARKKSELESFAVPYAVIMLLAMIVMAGSTPMLTAITEDKAQRVYEMLMVAASPFELMMGKVAAAIAVSITSSAFYIIGATLALQGLGMIGLVPFGILPWFYLYLVADVTILCAFASALGAACSSPQDAQSLAIVLISPVMIPLLIMVPILKQPNGVLATAASLFPPFTPMLMLLRQTMPGGVPAWQPWVGLIGVAACTIGTVWLAGRIFRVGILLQGKPPKVAELLRWAVRG